MRDKLKEHDGNRSRYAGIFEKFGKKAGWNHPEATVLLTNIRDESQQLITDHLWFNYTKEFRILWESKQLKPGCIIEFFGRVNPYEKGYQGYRENYDDLSPIETDYKLTRPTQVKIIGYDLNYTNLTCDPPFEYKFPKMSYLTFSHEYSKLRQDHFTTIRGESTFEYYEIGSEVKILLNSEVLFSAVIERMQLINLRSLPLEFLQQDATYDDFHISSYDEFIALLNSFRRECNYIRVSDPLLTVIYLRRIHLIQETISDPPLLDPSPQPYRTLDFFIKDRGALPL